MDVVVEVPVEAAGVTVKATDGLAFPFQVAVILAIPVEIPVANPIDEIVATESVPLDHVT